MTPARLRSVGKDIFQQTIMPMAIRSFRARAARSEAIQDAVRLAFGFNYCGIRIRPSQVKSEISRFIEEMRSSSPRVVVEIGTAAGGTLFLLSRAASEGALLISLDLPGGRFGGGYSPHRCKLYREFAREGQTMELLRTDSHGEEAFAKVANLVHGPTIDLLFIDGDHTYDGVKRDFEMYSRLVRPGGVIGFHDIVPGQATAVGEVPKFWKELCRTVRAREIVADWGQGGYGIGFFER